MDDPRLVRPLHTDLVYPGNGLPPRPGEDRPGLSPFGRLAMGGVLGVSSILRYDSRSNEVQTSESDMINLQGDDLDATQLILVLHPPRVVPVSFAEVTACLGQRLAGDQNNSEISAGDFPGTCSPIQWPPLEAVIEFGTGGVSTKVVVDYMNGVTVSVIASFLRVSAAVTQSADCGDICGTSAEYHLAAHVGPGFAESHVQRTIFIGEVEDGKESRVFDVPRFGKIATLIGCRNKRHKTPTLTVGWIRFWQDPKGECCVGDFFVSDHNSHVEVPNAAQYFSVYNESGHEMRMSVIFELAL